MLNKRLKILQVYKKWLQKPAKKGFVDFLENCICGDKNILDLGYGVDSLSQSYTHVFGKIFVAASVIHYNYLKKAFKSGIFK